MGLFRLMYCSRATGPQDYEALTSLLRTAQERNERDGITGLLCSARGHFFQVLEGDRAAVSRTLARILRDPRHTDVDLYDARAVETRMFPDWGMKLVQSERIPPGFLQRLSPTEAPEPVLNADRLLALFVQAGNGVMAVPPAPVL